MVDGAMMLPVNIMMIDAAGEALRMLITREGATYH